MIARVGHLLVAGVSGFTILVLEFAAVRLLAPAFGQSFYVWANVIGVILLALALLVPLASRGADTWEADLARMEEQLLDRKDLISGVLLSDAVDAINEENWAKARRLLKKVLKKNPHLPRGWFYMALARTRGQPNVAALRLARAGHRVRVLEAAAGPSRELRASTFHPPTLDMLAELGVAGPLRARGLEVRE